MKLVKANVSGIEKIESSFVITFHEKALVMANEYDHKFSNEEVVRISCSLDGTRIELSSHEKHWKMLNHAGIFIRNFWFESRKLLENETFKLLMKVEIEDYLGMQQNLITELENFNIRNLIDQALDKRDFESARKLVALCK
ncbi:hypothetical protein [Lysinibacillus sp. SGAir0095]|uniref:hypothetical protein n=1 Tax=Lysinibacillus sp. SGAir0095 TaxID=2070463 RepID=UPI0010CD110C|nr:hypothetical protein [Lysinibacillus sp. SGAir0095]QCR33153.1 hypothetical protein C1N55_13610 [Lysinibacillus sp. SGAir0095]